MVSSIYSFAKIKSLLICEILSRPKVCRGIILNFWRGDFGDWSCFWMFKIIQFGFERVHFGLEILCVIIHFVLMDDSRSPCYQKQDQTGQEHLDH